MILGIDVGGSHVDGVLVKEGRLVKALKRPVRDPLEDVIWQVMEAVLEGRDPGDLSRLQLSTTLSTNALIQDKTEAVGLLIQEGPGLHRSFSACRGEKIFLSGYADHQGQMQEEVSEKELEKALDRLRGKGLRLAAVACKFSPRNPALEKKIARRLEGQVDFISSGHQLSGSLHFPRRVQTAYINAAVYPTFASFYQGLRAAMDRLGLTCPVYVLKADGGTLALEEALGRPAETILSGPAASFMGFGVYEDLEGDALLLDVGGTTTDFFFLAQGQGLAEPFGAEIGDFSSLITSVYCRSIGLGGDSALSIDGEGLRMGPDRKGPAYALGGPLPTPTDAFMVLGLMEAEPAVKERAGRGMDLLIDQARRAGFSGQDWAESREKMAQQVIRSMAQAIDKTRQTLLAALADQPVYRVDRLLYKEALAPKLILLMGGPARSLAPFLEEATGLSCRAVRGAELANALGAALARPTDQVDLLVDTEEGILTAARWGLRERVGPGFSLEEAKDRAEGLLREQGPAGKDWPVQFVEASAYPRVRGFRQVGQHMRVRAQLVPGYFQDLKGGDKGED